MAKTKDTVEPKLDSIDVYKRVIICDEKTKTYKIDDQEYVEVPTEFAKTMTKLMKTGSFYEDLIVVNKKELMRKDKFEAYQQIAKAISVSKNP